MTFTSSLSYTWVALIDPLGARFSKQEQNPRHPWQSWRDRYQRVAPTWSKNTNTRLSPVSDDADSLQGPTRPERKHTTRSRRRESFSEDEAKMLLDAGKDLLRVPPDKLNEVWGKQLHRFDVSESHIIDRITSDTSSRSGSILQASGETSGNSPFDLNVWILRHTRRAREYHQ